MRPDKVGVLFSISMSERGYELLVIEARPKAFDDHSDIFAFTMRYIETSTWKLSAVAMIEHGYPVPLKGLDVESSPAPCMTLPNGMKIMFFSNSMDPLAVVDTINSRLINEKVSEN